MIEIGKLITDSQERDAIHVAVAPVVAFGKLYPGNHIGFVKNDNRTVGATASKKIGIVDPFLTEPVDKGEQFWMFLYPNTITSLRHDWIHPEFREEDTARGNAIQWITKWALTNGISYEYAMQCGDNRDFFVGHDVDYSQIPEQFWDNYEIIRDTKVPKVIREETYFHCAC